MKKKDLTLSLLQESAIDFCTEMSKKNHPYLSKATDGKTVGTYVEHKFKEYLSQRFTVEIGNSADGIDLPGHSINTDIKVTSITQPQSSCPFKNIEQKIYGLGYNLLVFVYEKKTTKNKCILHFTHCTFISSNRTGDYTLTKRLREMLKDDANKEDIMAYLQDKGVPGDELAHGILADKVLSHTPEQGYLTISNALQWRLQYKRVIGLQNTTPGVFNHEW